MIFHHDPSSEQQLDCSQTTGINRVLWTSSNVPAIFRHKKKQVLMAAQATVVTTFHSEYVFVVGKNIFIIIVIGGPHLLQP